MNEERTIMIVKGGFTNYGQTIGIIMLDTDFPRIPGDIGNALTYSFPVRYRKVKDASTGQVVLKKAAGLLQQFINAAQELQEEGVKAITTSCGFLAIYQNELASAVRIPVFTSSLLQVPLIYKMLRVGQKVGIITANASTLTEEHFNGVGWSARDIPVVIAGMETVQEFPAIFVHGTRKEIDVDNVTKEILCVGESLLQKNPEVGAIVLECTNMPPFKPALQEHLRIPVFDIITLINMVYSSIRFGE